MVTQAVLQLFPEENKKNIRLNLMIFFFFFLQLNSKYIKSFWSDHVMDSEIIFSDNIKKIWKANFHFNTHTAEG